MKPILFNTEMVKAILDGRKTVTRRLVKPQPFVSCKGLENECKHETGFFDTGANDWACRKSGCGVMMNGKSIYHAPYQVGDILYVRETWCDPTPDHDMYPILYKADFPQYYSSEETEWGGELTLTGNEYKWCPSIHMPKEAARTFLRVKDIRVERLQDMDHDAPAKEGIRGYTKDGELYKYAVSDDWWIDYHRKHKKEFRGTYWQDMPKNPTIAFSYLWNSTIPKKSPSDMYEHGWKANPWVWVIEFERCENSKLLEGRE